MWLKKLFIVVSWISDLNNYISCMLYTLFELILYDLVVTVKDGMQLIVIHFFHNAVFGPALQVNHLFPKLEQSV